VYLQGIGQVKVSVHRRVEGRVKTIQVRRQGRHWMLILSCDQVPTRPAVGIDARYDLLVVEDLRIRNLVRRPAPRPDPDHPGGFLANRAAAKTGLHRSIHDAGWAQFVWILRAKAEEAGRVVIDVDARHTSDRCEACGHTAAENRATQAVFPCRGCGHTANADEHAARNILRAGLARLAATPAA
jgi:putative transposase